MKKIIALLSSLLLITFLVGNIVFSIAEESDSFVVEISEIEIFEGEKVAKVPIKVSSNDLSAMVIDLEVPENLKLIDIETNRFGVQKNINEAVLLYNSSSIDVEKFDISETFATLVFELPEESKVGDVYYIRLKDSIEEIDASDYKGNIIIPEFKEGKISVINDDLKVSLDSVNCSQNAIEVDVPFRIETKTGLTAINAQFNINNGAEIVSITPNEEYIGDGFQYNSVEQVILWSPLINENKIFTKESIFANIKVRLPKNKVAGDVFELSVIYFDSSDKELKIVSPKEIVPSKIEIKTSVVAKIKDMYISSEDYENLKTVDEYDYLQVNEKNKDKKVVEVPIEIQENDGFFSFKGKLVIDDKLEFLGYKKEDTVVSTFPESSFTRSSNLKTFIWLREAAGNSLDKGEIVTLLIALPTEKEDISNYSVEFDTQFTQFTTSDLNDIVATLKNGSIVVY